MEYNMEKLISLFENNNDITFILQNDLAFELIEMLELRGHRFGDTICLEEVQKLYESNVLRVSRCESFGKEDCYFEVAYGNEHLKYIEECTIAIIEEGVIEPWEIEEYVEGGYVLFIFTELDEDEELYEEYIDEDEAFVNDIIESLLYEIDSLNGNKCAIDVLKSYLLDVYETGYVDGIRDSIEDLTDKLKEQFYS